MPRFLQGQCTNSSCNYWHPPVCLNYKSETGCAYGKKFRFRHVEIDGQPSENSKKSDGNSSVALLKESVQLGCVCHDSQLSERGTVGSKHFVKFSKGTWHHLKRIRERKGPSLGVIQKCELHERNLCAPRLKERTQDDTVHQKKMRPQSSMGLDVKCLQAQQYGQSYVLLPC